MMKKIILVLFLLLMSNSVANADRFHHEGFRDHSFGFRFYVNPFYAPVYPYQYSPAPPIILPREQYWYFCDDPYGYYPNVLSCNVAWRIVTQ